MRQAAVALRRRDDGDVRHAGDARRDDRHQHGAGQRRGAAGDVRADPLDGAHELAQRALVAVLNPTDGRLAAMEGFDATGSQSQSVYHVGRNLFVGGGDLLGRDGQTRPAPRRRCAASSRAGASSPRERTSARIRRTASSGVMRWPKMASMPSRSRAGTSISSHARRRRMVLLGVGYVEDFHDVW